MAAAEVNKPTVPRLSPAELHEMLALAAHAKRTGELPAGSVPIEEVRTRIAERLRGSSFDDDSLAYLMWKGAAPDDIRNALLPKAGI